MRKGALIVIALCVLMVVCSTSCSEKKMAAADSIVVDSIADTVYVDTLEELISEQPMPKAADELFDDFFFNFAANRKLQLNRIAFPLPIKEGESIDTMTKSNWRMERFFMEQGFYTLILDNRKHLKAAKDTSVNNVVVEKIDIVGGKVHSFNFNRLSGQWHLTSIDKSDMAHNRNVSFLQFYQRFATDSAFLMHSLNNPLSVTGPSPDDDFTTITYDLMPEDWKEIGLEDLPNGLLYNIIYGQEYKSDDQKVFLMRGIANGLEVELTFKRVDDKWKLVKVVE